MNISNKAESTQITKKSYDKASDLLVWNSKYNKKYSRIWKKYNSEPKNISLRILPIWEAMQVLPTPETLFQPHILRRISLSHIALHNFLIWLTLQISDNVKK